MLEKYWINQLNELECLQNYELYVSSGMYLIFQCLNKDRRLTLGVGDISKMMMHSIGGSITFRSIESYMQNLDETPLTEWRRSVTQAYHTKMTGHDFGQGIYDTLPLYVSSKDDVRTSIELTKKYFVQDAKPFFDYWKDITCFLPFLELDYDDQMGLWAVFGSDMTIKKCIVWHLTSHPDYKKYLNHQMAKFETKIKLDPMNKELKNAFNVFMERIDKLERDEPLFDWKPEFLNRQDS